MRTTNCRICNVHFEAKSSVNNCCSELCRKEQKKLDNLRYNHLARGYAGYGFKKCDSCFREFKMKTSRNKYCDSKCALIGTRKLKNINQKKYHKREKSNPEYILKRILRTSIGHIISRSPKRSHFFCNYTPFEFKERIQSLFKEGMNWDNWGMWHVDHIKPLSSFNFLDKDGSIITSEVIKANSLENLQPLWACENLKKHARYDHES